MHNLRILVPVLMLVSQASASAAETHLTTTGPSLSTIHQHLQPGENVHCKRDDDENLIGYFVKDGESKSPLNTTYHIHTLADRQV